MNRKGYRIYLTALLALVLLAASLTISGVAYADSQIIFLNGDESNPPTVMATINYVNSDSGTIEVTGFGLINRNLWNDMCQAAPYYYKITFDADSGKKISLPQDCSQFFASFGNLYGLEFDPGEIDTSQVLNMHRMFDGFAGFNWPLDDWDTSNVTDMSFMFKGCTNFNQTINSWDTSNVVSMVGMFKNASSFNKPLDGWNTSSVQSMKYMFYGATNFNQSIDSWDISSVNSLEGMFMYARAFNQPLSGWNTANVTNMSELFQYTSDFNQPLNGWNTANVTNMSRLFASTHSFNQPLNNWNTANVTNMRGLFYDAKAFNESIVGWDTGNVTDMSYMFSGTELFNQSLAGFNTSAVTTMEAMFYQSKAFNQPIASWDTSAVTTMNSMFCEAKAFNQPLAGWDTSAVTNMESMFAETEVFNQSLNGWDTSNLLNAARMFYNSKAFNGAVDGWDVSKLEVADTMFARTEEFNQPLNSWNTASLQTITNMFFKSKKFNQPLDNWDTSNLTNTRMVFNEAAAFNQPIVNWDTSNAGSMHKMFNKATSFNQAVKLNISSLETSTAMQDMFSETRVKSLIIESDPSGPIVDSPLALSYSYSTSDLQYLEFEHLKAFTISGFAGDYIVEKDGVEVAQKAADDNYQFEENHHYRVYLQPISAPSISVGKAGSAIKVWWDQVSDATGYQVFRADAAAGPYTLFKTTTGLSYTNSGALVPGMPYFYKVRAYKNDGGNYTFSDYSAVKGYYAPGTLAKPAAPSLTLDENAGGIRLNWNSQPRITGYQIFRGVSTDKPFSYLKTTSGLAQVYTNLSGLNPGRPYYYKIRAYRTAGGVTKYGDFSTIKGLFAGTNEPALNAVNFNLGDNNAVSAPNVRVTWSGVSGADGYCVYRWDGVHKNWIGLKATGPNARVYTNINGVVSGKTFFYGMRPLHISGGTTYYGNIGQAKGYKVP